MFLDLVNHLRRDSLYRNALYLMGATAVLALLGYLFWLVCARLFTPLQVGTATALVSVSTLLANLSLLGLNQAIVRYLPGYASRDEALRSAFLAVAAAAVLAAGIFLAGVRFFSPALAFLNSDLAAAALFTLAVMLLALNFTTEAAFIGYQSGQFIFAKNTLLSLVKLALPFALVTFGVLGIFASVTLATAAAVLFSLVVLVARFHLAERLSFAWQPLRVMLRFSLANYAAALFSGLPALVLPVLVVQKIGSAAGAYFYIDLMIANLLYIIPVAATQSLYSEGSWDEAGLGRQIRRALGLIAVLLLPAIAAVFALGGPVLSSFGGEYARSGLPLLRWLAAAGIFVAANNIFSAALKVRRQVRRLVAVNLVGSAVLIVLSLILAPRGLAGMGVAWLAGQSLTLLLYALSEISLPARGTDPAAGG